MWREGQLLRPAADSASGPADWQLVKVEARGEQHSSSGSELAWVTACGYLQWSKSRREVQFTAEVDGCSEVINYAARRRDDPDYPTQFGLLLITVAVDNCVYSHCEQAGCGSACKCVSKQTGKCSCGDSTQTGFAPYYSWPQNRQSCAHTNISVVADSSSRSSGDGSSREESATLFEARRGSGKIVVPIRFGNTANCLPPLASRRLQVHSVKQQCQWLSQYGLLAKELHVTLPSQADQQQNEMAVAAALHKAAKAAAGGALRLQSYISATATPAAGAVLSQLSNSSLREVQLSFPKHLGQQGSSNLAFALQKLPNLSSLALKAPRLEDQQQQQVTAAQLADALQQLTALEGLALHGNLVDWSADSSSSSSSSSISAQQAAMYPEAAAAAKERAQLANMRSLVAASASLPRLVCLAVSEVPLGPAALGLGATAQQLASLCLGECQLTDVELNYILLRQTSLQRLSIIDEPEVTDSILPVIGHGMQQLQVLSLHSCGMISGEGLGCLAGMQQLTQLYVGETGVNEDEARWLQQRMQGRLQVLL
ncbi:hypothetical protein OEZ86_007031 [Tetradesmus obliquus]|nr:hypothetical protein OEZ86_007031 [Tetradesmus obliquus]